MDFCTIFIYRSPEPETPPITVPLISITHPSDVLDMPVDPNEPTYCLCHQVSYGEMIGCDNADVSMSLKVKGFVIIQVEGCKIILSETKGDFMTFVENSVKA